MSDAAAEADDTMRDRASVSAWQFRVLLGANRWMLAVALAGVVFASIVVVDVLHPVASSRLLETGDPVETLFQAFVGAIVTGVTLVLTLNQLVLSQELGAAGDQRERMSGALSFRREAADVLSSSTAPAEPSAFLRALVTAAAANATELREAVDASNASESFASTVTSVARSVETNASTVADALEGEQFGTFAVTSAALDFDYSWQLYATRRLQTEHAEACPERVADAFEELATTLELFGVAREHVKTLYFQDELVALSRVILYAAIPALGASTLMIVFFDPTAPFLAAETAGVSHAMVVIAFASTVAVFPFTLLLSYVLRIATVAKRTLSIGPFVLRDTDRRADLDVDTATVDDEEP